MYVCSNYKCVYIPQPTTLCTIGWLRSVGSIKSFVSFAEYRLFYRSLLQKRLIILSILLTKATPYNKTIALTFEDFIIYVYL